MPRRNKTIVIKDSDIMAINRLRMGTDGRGVTTLVAFSNCPLHCKYCINDQCHVSENKVYPKRVSYTPEELVKLLSKDEIYYLMSYGGVVFGGGEPLLQAEFIHKVCALANPKWNIRIETSLNVPWKMVKLLIDDIDEWIIDIKDMNPEIYQAYTNSSIDLMKSNLLKLKKLIPLERLHIRVPRIPNYNEEKDIEYSVNWIMDNIGVDCEVFDYIELNDEIITIKSILRKLGFDSIEECLKTKQIIDNCEDYFELDPKIRRAWYRLNEKEEDFLDVYIEKMLIEKTDTLPSEEGE